MTEESKESVSQSDVTTATHEGDSTYRCFHSDPELFNDICSHCNYEKAEVEKQVQNRVFDAIRRLSFWD